MKMAKFIGKDVSELLACEPYRDWPVERMEDSEDGEVVVEYIFEGKGLQLSCSGSGRVNVIFMVDDEDDGGTFDDSELEVRFAFGRTQVSEVLGSPDESGEKSSDFGIEMGAWDLFHRDGYELHVEYQLEKDAVQKFTLMHPDAAPE